MTVTPEETRTVRLRLTCLAPSVSREGEPTVFGLQDKRQTVDRGRRRPDGAVEYECTARVRRVQADPPRFSGPCVHGSAADPFLYLSWRREAEPVAWIRRLKISLATITWEQVVAASAVDGRLLYASVAGTGSARVPLLGGGWTVRTHRDP